jgi:hypothetical protein
MLKHRKESMSNYMNQVPHGNFGVETRRVVREERFNKFARIPVARFLLALFFIAKDDAFLRPHKPDPKKPMFYRRGLWKVHNCGQRKDGTFLTSGNAAFVAYGDGNEIYNSTDGELTYSELKSRFGRAIP